ncbi:MAG: glycerophosphodiester phosphodiesterase family protein [Candidatus Aureabacteria bacterium]|nr:glycerophosphodiester phosphodiesterase family protein [Candidatus Auribacterota bacterium]
MKSDNSRVLNVAHRGYSSLYPENTILAFEKAIEERCDMLELDVQLTADGEIVVFHDFTLERTTDGSGELGRKTLAELRELDAGSWRGVRFAGQRIPTLRELLDCVRRRVKLYIEIKAREGIEYKTLNERLCSTLAGLLSREAGGNELLLASFDSTCLRQMKELIPEFPRGLICFRMDALDGMPELVDWICPYRKNVNSSLVRKIKEKGLKICPWTVDDAEEMSRLIGMEVDAIATNNPALLRGVIAAGKRNCSGSRIQESGARSWNEDASGDI